MVERVPGAVGAIFVDWEGEAVDQFAHMPELEIQLVGAHWGVVLNQTTSALDRHPYFGPVEALLVEGDRATVLVRRVTERYYVVLTTKRGAHLATAQRELERSAETLRGEMG
jgi:predicted regulator of Ras-like GTPase activity (Roadblock/LC7/MglB family)